MVISDDATLDTNVQENVVLESSSCDVNVEVVDVVDNIIGPSDTTLNQSDMENDTTMDSCQKNQTTNLLVTNLLSFMLL
jgi:hypothetical protein